jgi:hypothetical protein
VTPRGLVGLRRPDRHREALAGDVLDVAHVERGQFGPAGEQGEPQQDDGTVAQARARRGVAGGKDGGQVGRHERDRLARPVAAVPGGLAPGRGADHLAGREGVWCLRPGPPVHGADRGQVRVRRGRLEPPVHRQVSQVGGHGLRGRRERRPSRAAAPGLERPPPRPVGQGGVLRHGLPDQRGGRRGQLEVGWPVPVRAGQHRDGDRPVRNRVGPRNGHDLPLPRPALTRTASRCYHRPVSPCLRRRRAARARKRAGPRRRPRARAMAVLSHDMENISGVSSGRCRESSFFPSIYPVIFDL